MKKRFLILLLALVVNVVASGIARNSSDLNYRLPKETSPKHYDIAIKTDVHTGDRAFEGRVIIDISVERDTSQIVLHARQLKISNATIESSSTGESEELSFFYEDRREFLVLERRDLKDFIAGTEWKLTIFYSGELRDDKGFILQTFSDDEGKDQYLAATLFEGTDARHAFPCYDEPGKRATFTITIIHSPTYTAVSDMPVDTFMSSPGITAFSTSALVPTYRLAFVVSNLDYTETDLGDIKFGIYSRHSTKHEFTWISECVKLMLDYMSEYTGIRYMPPKFDIAVIPNLNAGNEGWGLAIYDEEILKFNKEYVNVYTQSMPLIVLASLVSQTWFGQYVTHQWWSTYWVDAGLANILAFKILDNIRPDMEIWQIFFYEIRRNRLIDDRFDSSKPVALDVQNPTEIEDIHSGHVQGKSVCIAHMWSNALAEEVFRIAIQNVLKNNQYSTVSEEALFEAIQDAATVENYTLPASVDQMMRTWPHQRGYPLLTVTRNYTSGTFAITQEPYYKNASIKDSTRWYVPFNYAHASNPDFNDTRATHYLLNVYEMKFDDVKIRENDWLILNKQATGYYRIMYDEKNYELIADCLIKTPHVIDPLNRAQLIEDAYFLSNSKHLDHGILLKILTYLKNEYHYAPLMTAIDILDEYKRYLGENDDYKFFLAKLIGPIFQRVGVSQNRYDIIKDNSIRRSVSDLACVAGMKDCLEKAKALTRNAQSISDDVLFCYGIRESDDEQFNYFYKKLMDPGDEESKKNLIKALACTTKETNIQKLLNSITDKTNKLSASQRMQILTLISAKSKMGLLASIKYLKENYDAFNNLDIENSPLVTAIKRIAWHVFNKETKKELLNLMAKVNDTIYISPSQEMIVNKLISKNLEWIDNLSKPILKWLAKYRDDRVKKSFDYILTVKINFRLFIESNINKIKS